MVREGDGSVSVDRVMLAVGSERADGLTVFGGCLRVSTSSSLSSSLSRVVTIRS